MRIAIIGCGYVGLTTGIALAYIGHKVDLIDSDSERIGSLQKGIVPIHEPGVEGLLGEVRERMSFGYWDSFDPECDVVVIAVGTPRKENGDADLSFVESVASEIGRRVRPDKLPVIVNKSTVPIGSSRRVESIVAGEFRERGIESVPFVASNPEFLREGVALFDTFYPDRIVIGANNPESINRLREMYSPILEQTFISPESMPRPDGFSLPALITTTPESAELIKYSANTFLAMKISFINEVAGLAERVGADIKEVARGIGLDKRIGLLYLNAGLGWGGSCFGKDVQALIHTAKQYDYEMPISKAAIEVNKRQREHIIKKLQSALKVIRGNTVGILGLAFKPGTDDLRDAPSITVVEKLIELGAAVKVYDPVAMDNFKRISPNLPVEYASGVEELFKGSDAVVLVTEWKEFVHLPYGKLAGLMRQKNLIDGRNALEPKKMSALGFNYIGVGR